MSSSRHYAYLVADEVFQRISVCSFPSFLQRVSDQFNQPCQYERLDTHFLSYEYISRSMMGLCSFGICPPYRTLCPFSQW
jgi:hypothetical protein